MLTKDLNRTCVPALFAGVAMLADEWKIRPERSDNHWFDCLVGCAVAASMQGVSLAETTEQGVVRRERVKLSELQRSRR